MKKIFLILILFGAGFLSFVFGGTIEDEVDRNLLKYGVDGFKPVFHRIQKDFENDLKESLSTILDEKLFIINVALPLKNFLLHDSTHVVITHLEGRGVKWDYLPESQKQKEAFLKLESTPTSLTNFFVYTDESLVLYLSFKPIIQILDHSEDWLSFIDIGIFIGSIGFFLLLFLLYARSFPVIAQAEVKSILKSSGENYKKSRDSHE